MQITEEALKDLIEGCKTGERKAQHKVYNLYARKMYGVCLRYSKDNDEAEDILQDGFIKVFTKINQFNFAGSFEGWIRKIMVNTALEYYRKSSKLHPVSDLETVSDQMAEENIISTMNAAELTKLIQSLPTGYRTVFNLFGIEGYTHAEIGEQLGISENTSKSQFSRAKMALQNLIKNSVKKNNYGRG